MSSSIVIIGGGIIGCTTAYYLSQWPGYQIILLEASGHGVAHGASGKAGGVIAKWAFPRELVNVSFREHVALSERLDGASRWGWRYVKCGAWEGEGEIPELNGGATYEPINREETGLPDDLTWVSEHLTHGYYHIAPAGDTAQVYPDQFTSSMLELACENGVRYIAGQATLINIDENRAESPDRKVTGVEYRDSLTGTTKTLQCSRVILAAGAWSPTLLPVLPIAAKRIHSIVLQPSSTDVISPYVLFTYIMFQPEADDAEPEICARPNNQVYVCGSSDDSALPITVDDVEVDETACENIRRHVSSISEQLREATVVKRQACFLPDVKTGEGPIIGEAKSIAEGLIIAVGHTCWVGLLDMHSHYTIPSHLSIQGICNAPGTAKAIAELVEFGEIRCANLNKFQPSRFF